MRSSPRADGVDGGEIISRAAAASRGRFERALQGPEDRGFTDLIVGRQSCHGFTGSVPLGDLTLLADIKGRLAAWKDLACENKVGSLLLAGATKESARVVAEAVL